MKWIKPVIYSLLIFLIMASPVMAADEQPTKVSLYDIEAFNSLLVDDDFLAVVPYELTFSTNPEALISQTYIFRILNSDATEELGSVLAVPAYNSGYGYGVISFYIESGMTVGATYILRVQQSPSYYDTPQYWDFTLDSGCYSTASDQAVALKTKIIDTATILEEEFSVSLLSKAESGQTVLSTYGELYYLDVIPGLQSMCPELFEVQLESPDYTKRTWSTTFAEALKTKYAGTFIYDFMTGYAGLFNLETSPAMNFFSSICFMVMVGFSVWKCKASVLSALLDGYTLLLLLMLIGFFSMIWAGFIAFISAAIGGSILFFKRA